MRISRQPMLPERPSLPLAMLLAGLAVAACDASQPADPGPSADNEAATIRTAALQAGLAPLPDSPVYPPDNPHNPDRVSLGHLLFFDPILSGPQNVACSTCHLPRFAFADGRQFPSGAGGSGLGPQRTVPGPWPLRPMPRNSPPMFNIGHYGRGSSTPTSNGTMFWHGGAFGLEDQTLAPISTDTELRGVTYPREVALDSVIARLRGISDYVDRFGTAFPELVGGGVPGAVINPTSLRLALAAYIRELRTPDAPIDRFLHGDDRALTDAALRGLDLFISDAGCVQCHTGPLLSDFSMHVVGAPQEGLGRDTTRNDDLGWGEVGGTPYAFRTPPLRQVAETAPYLHAGTAESLAELLEFKNAGVSRHPAVSNDRLSPMVAPLGLGQAQLSDLEAFLKALTDETSIAQPLFRAPDRVPSGLEVPR